MSSNIRRKKWNSLWKLYLKYFFQNYKENIETDIIKHEKEDNIKEEQPKEEKVEETVETEIEEDIEK